MSALKQSSHLVNISTGMLSPTEREACRFPLSSPPNSLVFSGVKSDSQLQQYLFSISLIPISEKLLVFTLCVKVNRKLLFAVRALGVKH